MRNKKIVKPIVIVANGKYPSHPYAGELIKNANTIICTDGSANKLKNHGYDPTFVIGDMDSIINIQDFGKSEFLHIPKQDNTDLEKVFDFCIESLIKEVNILGATGIRDDLAMTNMLLLMKYHKKIKIKMVTDIYTIECFKGKQTFNSFPDQNISLIAVYGVKSVTTKGLRYSLTKQSLFPSGHGVSNTATGNKFTIRSSNRILLFRGHQK
jgi:thiamine pyrophosphokinase